MKIAFVGRGNLRTNASTLRALGMAPHLRKEGWEVHLFLPRDPLNEELADSGRNNFTTHFARTGAAEFVSKLRSMLSQTFDVVHCLNIGVNSYVVSLAYKLLVPSCTLVLDSDEFIQSLASPPWVRWVRTMTQAIAFNTADMFICASMFLKEMYEKRTTRTVMYLPYAIDVNRFTYLAGGRDTVLARYNQKKLVVYFGSFQPHFDVDKVVTLAKKIVTKEPGVTVLLIGDGPDRARLEAEVRNEGHQNILFLGFVSESDVPSYLSAASVLVFPIRDTITNRSRCPNKIFQFMAARRPVVTNRVGEVASAFKSYAHYFDFDSEEDFERKVREALSRPKVCPPEMVVQNDWSARVATYMQGVKQHLGDH